ncbi:MAG TPA: beta-L-arabinofuranosidase domain-containing protein [Phototrophicaceae bacterium]|nr:beta-L-arabinofuranosidase domain-containing protein [Phototrophicaceae bacterium]
MVTLANHLAAVPHQGVFIGGGFWGDRLQTNRTATIPAIYEQLRKTGRLDSWKLEPHEKPKRYVVIRMFWDSDTGKWLEAVGHSLRHHPDPELEHEADELIRQIQQAQQPDGYLNTYFTAIEPGKRWTNLRDWHEMYNAGHMIEGAVAYYQATGKRDILDVLARYADHIIERFGPQEGQKRGYPGHPELELALVKLYHATGEERYLHLAKYFIDERGQAPIYFDVEARERGEDPEDFWAQTYRYCQAHEPIRDQQTATGHSVRACYLYAGVADIARETGDQSLLETSRRLWDDLTQHQMYITGGLGPAHSNEGFTFAYDLPNETAYAETCASVALAFWAHRMFHLDPQGRYLDVLERALYNTVVAGVSLEGDHFFYANPLTSYPNVNPYEAFSGITSARYYRREEWLTCPCCPPNLARLLASLGDYFYSVTPDTLYAHLYNQNQTKFQMAGQTVQIEQQTHYPWDGDIQFTVKTAAPVEFTLAARIPGWCRGYHLEVNGTPVNAVIVDGYARIKRLWADGDQARLVLEMPVERMVANPMVRQDAGQVALQRGPLVYCLEEVDNGPGLANVVLPPEAALKVAFDAELLGGVVVITGEAVRREPQPWRGDLYQPQAVQPILDSKFTFKAIPYGFWANREPGEMRVWLRES